MSSIELTPSQRTILSALTNLHGETDDAVKGEDIAEEVDRNPGTIRNQMQSLKALQLVEGVPGPKGGYKPTALAFEALGVQEMDDPALVPMIINGELDQKAVVEEINLSSVHHPELCRAEVKLQGSVRDYKEGSRIEVGPTPLSKLRILGELEGKDATANKLILTIEEMHAPAEPTDK